MVICKGNREEKGAKWRKQNVIIKLLKGPIRGEYSDFCFFGRSSPSMTFVCQLNCWNRFLPPCYFPCLYQATCLDTLSLFLLLLHYYWQRGFKIELIPSVSLSHPIYRCVHLIRSSYYFLATVVTSSPKPSTPTKPSVQWNLITLIILLDPLFQLNGSGRSNRTISTTGSPKSSTCSPCTIGYNTIYCRHHLLLLYLPVVTASPSSPPPPLTELNCGKMFKSINQL